MIQSGSFVQTRNSSNLVFQNYDVDVDHCGVNSRTALIANLKLLFRFAGIKNLVPVLNFPFLLPSYLHYCFSLKSCHQALKINLQQKQTKFAQPNGKYRIVLAKMTVFVIAG